MLARDFLAQRVYDLTHVDLKLSGKTDAEIWQAIGETSDDELYKFYFRLVNERKKEN